MPRPIVAAINIKAMAHNLRRVREHVQAFDGQGRFWAVVKANAYGHGIELATQAFCEADGLALLDFEEAARARACGWNKPILMLEGIFSGEDLEPAQALNLSLVLHNCEQVRMLAKATIRTPLSIYMKLDTGMHRLGFTPEAYLEAFQQLQTLQRAGKVAHISHMTHFACADQPEGIVQPLAQFQTVLAGLPGHWSLSNSAACLRHAQTIGRCVSEQQRQSWSRPGICLYGASPFDDRRADQMGFRPTMTLRSQLISVKAVASGEGIGYGHVFIAPCDMRIGVVACGYADGYPRHAPTGTPVDVAGVRTSIIGRISMDMMMVDLSQHPGAAVGDEVVLWGEGGPDVDDVARSAGTIGYELLTAVTSRVARSVAA